MSHFFLSFFLSFFLLSFFLSFLLSFWWLEHRSFTLLFSSLLFPSLPFSSLPFSSLLFSSLLSLVLFSILFSVWMSRHSLVLVRLSTLAAEDCWQMLCSVMLCYVPWYLMASLRLLLSFHSFFLFSSLLFFLFLDLPPRLYNQIPIRVQTPTLLLMAVWCVLLVCYSDIYTSIYLYIYCTLSAVYLYIYLFFL